MINITDTGININNLTIDIPLGPIGISFSAGADSTILAYILMKYHPGMIHFFTIASKGRERAGTLNTIMVIDRLIELTGRTNNLLQHIRYENDVNTDTIENYLLEQANYHKTKVIYTGVTQAPPDEIIKTKIDPNIVGLRDPNKKKEPYRKNGLIYHPLINIDKKGIRELYQLFDVENDLFPYTRSCYLKIINSGLKGTDALTKTKHCGNCWWCEERKWAFGRL